MQNYYYLQGKTVVGPLSLEEMHSKSLVADTFVWYDGIENWVKLKDLPRLYAQLQTLKSTTPTAEQVFTNKAEVRPPAFSVTHSLKPSFISQSTRREKLVYKWILGWVLFNCAALLLSIYKVKGFNNAGDPLVDKFWPMVKFTEKTFTIVEKVPIEIWKTKVAFNGLFTQYDWSEFSAYVGGTLFLVLLYNVNKRSS